MQRGAQPDLAAQHGAAVARVGGVQAPAAQQQHERRRTRPAAFPGRAAHALHALRPRRLLRQQIILSQLVLTPL